MSDLDLMLKPFSGAQAPGWRRRLWALLLLGGPLMGTLGFWTREHIAQGPGLRVQIDRAEAVRMAQALARENGLNTERWQEHVKFNAEPVTERYLRTHDLGPRGRVRRFLPEATVTVLLMQPGGEQWMRATFGTRGFVTDYRLGGRGLLGAAPEEPAAQARARAETALKQWIGDMALRVLGEPEQSTAEGPDLEGARRFTWRLEPRNASDVELVIRIDVLGGRVVGRSVQPVFSAAFLEREVTRPGARADLLSTLRLVLVLCLLLYAFYRYARRTMEKEAPHTRVLLLAGMFIVVSVLFSAGNPDASLNTLDPGALRPSITVLRILLALLSAAVVGGVMGVSYGAGEGEVREGWPGKLTSLDAVLTGRVWSANVGVSVVAGAALAGWLFGLASLAQAALGEKMSAEAMDTAASTFGRLPLVFLLANVAMGSVVTSVLSLLAPLTFLRRHMRPGWPIVLLLAAGSLLIGGMSQRIAVDQPVYWLGAAALTAAVLGGFYLEDYLASVVAVGSLMLFTRISDMSAVAPYWRERADLVGFAAAAVLAPLAAAAWMARRVEEQDVRPAHARNLAERLSLQAELNAAREAQVRLLPERPPETAGLEIAATCLPAQAVSGDFYDFFPMSGGRLGLIVAEGGNEGLASALTIALAKGFLMYESAEGTAIEEAVARLEEALGANLNRDGGRTSLGLFLVDPRAGLLKMARTGRFPGLLLVRSDGSVREPAVWPHAEGRDLELARIEMRPGDAVVIYTDGLPRLMAERSAGTPAELLKKAAWFGQAWTAESLRGALVESVVGPNSSTGAVLSDDLTAVVLRYDGKALPLEGAA